MTNISGQAAQSRENARSTDGKFGHQQHDRAAGVDLLEPEGITPSDALRISSQLTSRGEARVSPSELPALGKNGLLFLESRDRSRSWSPVRADLLVDGPRDLGREDREDFDAYCRSLGGSSQIDAEGNGTFSVTNFEIKNAHDLDSLPGKLNEADPAGARHMDLAEGYREYREEAVAEREKVTGESLGWKLQDAQQRLEEEAFIAGKEVDYSDLPMDPATEQAARERVQKVLETNWAYIEDAAAETGMEREQIADAAADNLTWDSDWTPKLGEGPNPPGPKTQRLVETIGRHRGPFEDQSPFVHDGASRFE